MRACCEKGKRRERDIRRFRVAKTTRRGWICRLVWTRQRHDPEPTAQKCDRLAACALSTGHCISDIRAPSYSRMCTGRQDCSEDTRVVRHTCPGNGNCRQVERGEKELGANSLAGGKGERSEQGAGWLHRVERCRVRKRKDSNPSRRAPRTGVD